MCCGFADHIVQWSEMCLLGKMALVLVALASSTMFGVLVFLFIRKVAETPVPRAVAEEAAPAVFVPRRQAAGQPVYDWNECVGTFLVSGEEPEKRKEPEIEPAPLPIDWDCLSSPLCTPSRRAHQPAAPQPVEEPGPALPVHPPAPIEQPVAQPAYVYDREAPVEPGDPAYGLFSRIKPAPTGG